MVDAIQDRLERLSTIELSSGSHDPPNGDDLHACVMECVSYVAGEKWTDSPECACPAISAFLREWNDSFPNDAERTRLLRPLIPKLVGSKSTPEVEKKRSWMAFDWLVREFTPTWLELAGLTDHAEALRALDELVDDESLDSVNVVLTAAKDATESVAGFAAEDAAAAEEDAARNAVGAAAGDAAWSAAGDIEGSDVRTATWTAAWFASRTATWAAILSADNKSVEVTVARLQESALKLVHHMLEVN